MEDDFLSNDDWEVLSKAADRAKRGLRAYLSAEQSAKFGRRGYMAPLPRDPSQHVITGAGKIAVVNWARSKRR